MFHPTYFLDDCTLYSAKVSEILPSHDNEAQKNNNNKVSKSILPKPLFRAFKHGTIIQIQKNQPSIAASMVPFWAYLKFCKEEHASFLDPGAVDQ